MNFHPATQGGACAISPRHYEPPGYLNCEVGGWEVGVKRQYICVMRGSMATLNTSLGIFLCRRSGRSKNGGGPGGRYLIGPA